MATVRLYPSQHAVVDYVQPNYHGTAGSTVTLRNGRTVSSTKPRYVCKFDIPEEMRWSRIYSIDLYCYARSIKPQTSASGLSSYYDAQLDAYALKQPFDFINGTYADISNAGGGNRVCYLFWSSPGNRTVPSYQTAFNGYSSTFAETLRLANNGVFFAYEDYTNTSDNLVIDTATGTNKPYIDVTYIDGTVEITPRNISPTGGYIDDSKDKTFTWGYNLSYNIIDENGYLAASSFALEWQLEGGSIRTITATASGVTVPADTFPVTGSFMARVKITDPEGRVTYSDWATYTTTEAIPTATATAPVNTVESDVDPVKFRWQHKVSTGTEQTAAELQYSTDNINWYGLGNVSGNAASLDVKLSGIPAGTVYWRVRTANTDNVFSEWSAVKSFVLVAAPPTPIVSVEPVPLATIAWQASVQQAYRLTIDGEVHSAQFGTASSYTVREPLDDGEHTASIEVQGTFGLWSAPAELVFTVKNSPGVPVNLTAENGIDALLAWSSAATDAVFYIYRDGKLIGKTRETQFSDRLTAGRHEYSVLAVLSSGYYSRSNMAEAESGSDSVIIAEVDGGRWLDISLTPDSNGTQDFLWKQTNSTRHFSGSKLPVIELSEFEDETASYRTSMFSTDDAKEFEKLKGKICIVKSRRREVVVAAMVRLLKTVGNFFITFDFELQRIHWEDFRDDTNS